MVNTLWVAFWQFVRISLLVVYLVMTTRYLGVEEYGSFAGVVALVGCLFPLSGLGQGYFVFRHAANGGDVSHLLGKALVVIVLSFPVLGGIVFVVAKYIVLPGVDLVPLLLVILSDLLCVPVLMMNVGLLQAGELFFLAGVVQAVLNISRIAAIALLWVLSVKGGMSAITYAYAAGGMVATLVSLIVIARIYGLPILGMVNRSDLFRGGSYSFGNMASTAHSELDKVLMLYLGGGEASGLYSTAMRLVSGIGVPALSVIQASMPGLFRSQQRIGTGNIDLYKDQKQSLWLVLLCGLIGGLLMVAFAPLIPVILGEGFSPIVPVIRAFSLLPMAIGLYGFVINSLVCAGRLKIRLLFETTGVLINVMANWWLVKLFGVQGGGVAALISFGFVAIVAIMVLRFKVL